MSRKYVVKKNDSLWRISKNIIGDPKYWGKIASLNNIQSPYIIFVGQVLKIPSIPITSTSKKSEIKKKSTIVHIDNQNSSSGRAKDVGMPTLKHAFKFSIEQFTPLFIVQASIEVTISIREKGILKDVIFSTEGVDIGCFSGQSNGGVSIGLRECLKNAIDGSNKVISDMFFEPKITFNGLGSHPMFSFQCPLTIKTDLYTTNIEIVRPVPAHLKVKITPEPIKGIFKNRWYYDGNISGEINLIQQTASPVRVREWLPADSLKGIRIDNKERTLVPDTYIDLKGPQNVEDVMKPLPFYLAALAALKILGSGVLATASGVFSLIDTRIIQSEWDKMDRSSGHFRPHLDQT